MNGSMAMTNLVFPKEMYNQLSISGVNGTAKVRALKIK
ncbi:hypothetical protein [Klebsiella pneumoniae]